MSEQIISFAGTSLSIDHCGNKAAKVIDVLFRHINSAQNPAPPHQHYHLYSNNGSLILHKNNEFIFQEENDAFFAERLLGESSHDLADRVDGGLVLHAAGLAKNGHGMLLAGMSGKGKTTLTAYLFTQGLDLLSDEFIYLPSGTVEMQGLARPLNIKKAAKNVLEQYIDFASMTDNMFTGMASHLLPPDNIRPDYQVKPANCKLILFPNYQENGDVCFRALPKAEAAMELMRCLLNARNLTAHGFYAITSLVQSIPAYSLHYSSFDQIESHIMSLIEN